MNSIKKIFTAFLVTLFIFTMPNTTSAEEITPNAENISSEEVTSTEVKEFSAEGEYRLGDDDTRATAKLKALNDAKRKIAEQIGIYVETYSEMNKSNLTKDLIRTAAIAMIKVKSEKVEYSENGTLCKVFIVADADTNNQNIAEVIEKILKENTKKPDKTVLKVAGIWEYNNHYYKVFEESLTWYDANKRCKNLGGHLVTITSQEEQAAVQSIILYSGKKKNYYWTGGFRVEENIWRWNTGEDFPYENWAKGEPNNDLSNEFILIICNSGEWNDCPAEGINHIPDVDFFHIENAGYICEWDSFNDIKT